MEQGHLLDKITNALLVSKEAPVLYTGAVLRDAIYDSTGFLDELYRLDTYTDDMVIKFVDETSQFIFRETVNMKDISLQYSIMSNRKYLQNLVIVTSKKNFDATQRYYMNKVFYTYLKRHSKRYAFTRLIENDSNTEELIYVIARNINTQVINELIGNGVDAQLAVYLSIAYLSTRNERRKVLNVNNEITIWHNFDVEDNSLTEQDIVNIFLSLFPHMTDLFIGTMFDRIDINKYNMLKDSNKNVYSTIDLAVLDMIEQHLPYMDVVDILRSYYNAILWVGGEYIPRFNLMSISMEDYPNIHTAMLQCRNQFGMYFQ